MTDRDRLLEMLDRIHDGDAWHGPSVMSIVRSVPEARAEEQPVPRAHTIGEIARHIIGWRDEVRERLAGKTPSLPGCGDWPALSDGGWAATLAELDRSHRQLREAIAALPAERWDAQVGPSREAGLGTGVSYAVMLHGVIQHDVYHAGQMALLTKALG
jgi:uncharacterized damage-inducible protein DinB